MKSAALFGIVGLLAGCAASYVPPDGPIATAQKEVGGAEQAGAESVPDAKLHLQLARESLVRAKEMDPGNPRSSTLAERAKNEADLAIFMTRSAQAKAAADQAVEQLNEAKAK